jgi:hypothetical protein
MGVRGEIRSWSDWISYGENPVVTGEEPDPSNRVGRGFGGCDRLPKGGLSRPSLGYSANSLQTRSWRNQLQEPQSQPKFGGEFV